MCRIHVDISTCLCVVWRLCCRMLWSVPAEQPLRLIALSTTLLHPSSISGRIRWAPWIRSCRCSVFNFHPDFCGRAMFPHITCRAANPSIRLVMACSCSTRCKRTAKFIWRHVAINKFNKLPHVFHRPVSTPCDLQASSGYLQRIRHLVCYHELCRLGLVT